MRNAKKLLITIALIFILIVLVGLLVSLFSMDVYYHVLYSLKNEEGNQTINNIVQKSGLDDDKFQRLTNIGSLIVDDFTDPYFQRQQNKLFFCEYPIPNGTSDWGWCAPLFGIFGKNPWSYVYAVDNLGRTRTMVKNDLTFDPKWIAMQKTGACQELSVLFNETANRSGFVTRIVTSNGIKHWWNEVKIDDNWKFFYLQKYGIIDDKNMTVFYFGNASEYHKYNYDLYNITRCGVYVFNNRTDIYGEDITDSYDPLNKYSHGTFSSNNCS